MSLPVRLVLTLALALAPNIARADSHADAKELYRQGMAHYQLDEWDAAIDSWEDAFRKNPAAEILYNIAQAHRSAGHNEKALSFYRKFLRMAPSSPLRPNIERLMVDLEKKIAEKPEPAPVVTPTPAPIPPPAPAPVVVVPAQVSLTAAPPERAPRPLYKKGWFWGAVGGGVVAVAAAITLGVVLGTRDTGRGPLMPVTLGLGGPR